MRLEKRMVALETFVFDEKKDIRRSRLCEATFVDTN